MDDKTKKLCRIIGLIACLVLLCIIGKLLYNYNLAKHQDLITPIRINPPKKEEQPTQDVVAPQKKFPIFTRDENDVPKSDIQVPEIG